MKIKRKVQKNLPQLIEYAWENDVRDKVFWTTKDNRGVSYEACFSEFGSFYSDDILDSNVIFTIETEEEITEDTFFKHLIKVTEDGEHYSTDSFKVRDLIHLGTEEVHAYIDGEYKLIWTHEKGMVD